MPRANCTPFDPTWVLFIGPKAVWHLNAWRRYSSWDEKRHEKAKDAASRQSYNPVHSGLGCRTPRQVRGHRMTRNLSTNKLRACSVFMCVSDFKCRLIGVHCIFVHDSNVSPMLLSCTHNRNTNKWTMIIPFSVLTQCFAFPNRLPELSSLRHHRIWDQSKCNVCCLFGSAVIR